MALSIIDRKKINRHVDNKIDEIISKIEDNNISYEEIKEMKDRFNNIARMLGDGEGGDFDSDEFD